MHFKTDKCNLDCLFFGFWDFLSFEFPKNIFLVLLLPGMFLSAQGFGNILNSGVRIDSNNKFPVGAKILRKQNLI
jgi:hypothetical protein